MHTTLQTWWVWGNEPKEVSEHCSSNRVSSFAGFQDVEHKNQLNLSTGRLLHNHLSFLFQLIALPFHLPKTCSYSALFLPYAVLIFSYLFHLCFHSFELEPRFQVPRRNFWSGGLLPHLSLSHSVLFWWGYSNLQQKLSARRD